MAALAKPANPTSDALQHSTFQSGMSSPSSQSCSSTDPGNCGLPPPGCATEHIAVFEVKTLKSPSGHSRIASVPGGPRTPSPYMLGCWDCCC